jgi:hypothetical protein
MPRVSDQRGQQLILGGREVCLLVPSKNLATHQVYPNLAGPKDRLSSAGGRQRHTSKGDANTREQLRDPKRFGQVVVGPEIEGGHLILLLAPRREHNDRGAPSLADFPGNLQAIQVGEAEIE